MKSEAMKILKKTFTRKFIRTLAIEILMLGAIAMLAFRFTLNVTDSVQTGLYYKKIFPSYKKGHLATFEMKRKYLKYIEEFPNKWTRKKNFFLKRIAAQEGDIIENRDGNLYINGKKKGKILRLKGINSELDKKKKIKLGKNEFFMMGDSSESFDSRYYGPVNRSEFKNEVVLFVKGETLKKIFHVK